MIAAYLFVLADVALVQEPAPITVLQRGLNQVWNVQDTSLISTDPDVNFGGASTLLGGSGRTILIRFGDITRLVPPGKTVTSARLILTQIGGDPAVLQSLSKIELPWGEGPRRTFGQSFTAPDAKQKPKPPLGSATWKERRAQLADWNRTGAWGPKDATVIDAAALTSDANKVSISGLEKAVNAMANNPEDNHGFSIRLSSGSEFASSESATNRPRLELQLADAPIVKPETDLEISGIDYADGKFKVTVRNVGTKEVLSFAVQSPSEAGPTSVTAKAPLAPLASADLEIPVSLIPGRPVKDQGTLFRVVAPGDTNPRNDAATGFAGGLTVSANRDDVRHFNETYLGESRYSFAPAGANLRLNFKNIAEGGADGKEAVDAIYRQVFREALVQFAGKDGRFSGLSGWGDTRSDTFVPSQIPLPTQSQVSAVFDANPLVVTSLLNMTEVAYLNRAPDAVWPLFPKTIIVRVQDPLGRPLSGAKVSIETKSLGKTDVAKTDYTVSETGSIVVSKLDPSLESWSMSSTLNGETDTSRIYPWQFADAASRGNKDVAFFEVRPNLPGVAIDRTVDLAVNKLVTDSLNTPPAKLISLTQADPAAGVKIPAVKGGWIEIDLGRDRTIAEVELLFDPQKMWSRFDIVGYGTGQSPAEATPFAQEAGAASRTSPAVYRGPAPRVRYLRVINRADGPGELIGIRVRSGIL